MSCYNWERGTIKLPTAEFARIRKAMQERDAARKQRVLDQTQVFWKGLTRKQQTDPAEYAKAVAAFTERLYSEGGRPATTGWYGRPATPGPNADIASDVTDVLDQVARGTYVERKLVPGKPRRVLKTDMEFPTNRTTSFGCSEAAVSFDTATSSVTWDTGENNRQVESAHESWLGQAFFTALSTVKWTRGTGGWLVGNDEYNRESDYAGGGANYITSGFGPLAAADPEAHSRTNDYTDSKGQRVRSEDFPGRKAWLRRFDGGQRRSSKTTTRRSYDTSGITVTSPRAARW